MRSTFSNFLSLANVAAILLTATIGRPQVVSAVSVQLFADSGCPASNPGPICTDLPLLTCCKDHVGDIVNYYTSAHFEGLTGIDRATIAWTWNVDSKCGRRGSIDYYKSACLETERSRKDGYGAYWGITPSYGLPLPTATALANSSAFVGARGEVLAECRGSVAPDIYHIKLSTDSPAIPVARKAFEVMASATNMKRDADDLQVGEFADRETGLVKAEKLAIVQETLEKYGDGLTSEQIQALKKLRG